MFGYLIEKYYIFCIMNGDADAEDKRRQMDMRLTSAAESLLQTSVWSNWELSLKTISEDMMYLFKECVADLIGILTLKISMDDYLQALIYSAGEQGQKEDRIDFINLVRSALVVFCMSSVSGGTNSVGNSYIWDIGMLDNTESLSPDAKSLKNKIRWFISTYMTVYSREKCDTEIHAIHDRLYVFLRTDILETFEKYFVKCRDVLNKHYEESPDMSDMRMNLVYKVFQNSRAEEMVLEIQKYIAEYYKKVQTQIKQCAEDEGNGDNG